MTIKEYSTLVTEGIDPSDMDFNDPRVQSLILLGHNTKTGFDVCVYEPPTSIEPEGWTYSTDIDSVMFLSPTRIPLGSGDFHVCKM